MPEEEWCSLPTDILELVADRLNSFADRVRLRSVCRWWRYAVSPAGRTYYPPYLYLVNKVFCLVEKRSYHLPIKQQRDFYRPLGSSNGWLALVDSEADFYLFNPFSGDRIDLPPLWTIPDVQPVRYNYVNEVMVYCLKSEAYEHSNRKPSLICAGHLCKYLITRFAISPNMTAVAVHSKSKKLAFASPDSECWTDIPIPTGLEGFSDDVVYHDACGVFFAIDKSGVTISVDVANGNVETVVESDPGPDDPWSAPCLASLPTGELLCLYMLIAQPGNVETLRFEVLKLDRKTARWIDVEMLDGWTIFFDSISGARAQPTAEVAGCKGNCIYFALGHRLIVNGEKLSFTDIGMFDIAEKRVRPIRGAEHGGWPVFWMQL